MATMGSWATRNHRPAFKRNCVFALSIRDPFGWTLFSLSAFAALGNATDLFWDGGGTNNCWALNIFGTSMPPVLPPCL
jgi:hypothetical protein